MKNVIKKTGPKTILFCFSLVIFCALFTTSCYEVSTRTPADERPLNFNDWSEIKVVLLDGSTRIYISGSIKETKFFGGKRDGTIEEIDLSKISHFVLKRLDRGKTDAVVAGVVMASAVVTASIIAGTYIAVRSSRSSSSCPRVYTFNGKEWLLSAEPYSGAIFKSAEITDYSVLEEIVPVEGVYRLNFSNVMDEIDYTNEVKILVVDHDPTFDVVPGNGGEFFTISNPQAPVYAVTHDGVDITSRIKKNGETFWEGNPFSNYADSSRPREEMILKFTKPEGVTGMKLILRGGNTLWGSYILQNFLQMFGNSAKKRLDRWNFDPGGKEKIEKYMRKSGAWIEVQIKEDGKWREAGFFREVGPVVIKTQVLKINLPENSQKVVEIKLRWAPLFWKILRVAADFSPDDKPVRVIEVESIEAKDAKKGDIKSMISMEDNFYYRAVKGDEAFFTFPVPPFTEGMKRTIVLKTTGYYNLVFPDKSDVHLMKKMDIIFKKKGMDVYSLEEFRKRVKKYPIELNNFVKSQYENSHPIYH